MRSSAPSQVAAEIRKLAPFTICVDVPSRCKIDASSRGAVHQRHASRKHRAKRFSTASAFQGTVRGLMPRRDAVQRICRKLDNCRNVVTVAVFSPALAAAYFSASTVRRQVVAHNS
jgi:hypothetical protein